VSKKQDALPTILLFEQDEQTRPVLSTNLRNWGYRVIMALNEEDAIASSTGLQPTAETGYKRNQPDLILLNQVEQSIDEYINMGRRIRDIAGIPKQTPIVVIAERYEKDMEGKNVSVGESEYVTYLEDGEQLMKFLHHLCPVEI
jgi:CheY-like chemotaxis protein